MSGWGGNDVGVEEEGVEYVGPVPAEPADEPDEGDSVPRRIPCCAEARKPEVDDGHARREKGAFARAAFKQDQHAGVDSAVVQPAGKQDYLLLGAAEA
jgi:hypothetical protein